MVRKKGLEPSRPCGRQPLKLVRLPIPPLPRGVPKPNAARADGARYGLGRKDKYTADPIGRKPAATRRMNRCSCCARASRGLTRYRFVDRGDCRERDGTYAVRVT